MRSLESDMTYELTIDLPFINVFKNYTVLKKERVSMQYFNIVKVSTNIRVF